MAASISLPARIRALRRDPNLLAGAISVLVFNSGRIEFQVQGAFPGHPQLARVATAIRRLPKGGAA